MKKNALDLKCINCNAVLKLNPETQKWDCEYCGSSFNEEEVLQQTGRAEEQSVPEEQIDLDEYSCPSCGATVVTDTNTSATACVYCGNTAIMKNRLEGKFRPDKLIPFRTKKEEAVESFLKFVNERKFAPDEFKNKQNIEKVSGVYIPFWLFDCKTTGDIEARCKNYKHWSDVNYNYTKTDTYHCIRRGDMSFTDIPADGSSKFQDDIMDSIEPYDYNGFQPFQYPYLSGFLAEKYDKDPEEVYERAKVRAENTTTSVLTTDLNCYSNRTLVKNQIEIENGKIEYALLPVWLLNFKYEDKIYPFAMNGQTGKMIGNVPIQKKKVINYIIKRFGIIASVGVVIALIVGLF